MKLKAAILSLVIVGCMFMIHCGPQAIVVPTAGTGGGLQAKIQLFYRDTDVVKAIVYVGQNTSNEISPLCIFSLTHCRDAGGEFGHGNCKTKFWGPVEFSNAAPSVYTLDQTTYIDTYLQGSDAKLIENGFTGTLFCEQEGMNLYFSVIQGHLDYVASGGGGTPPWDPTGLIAQAVGPQINLQWTDTAMDEDGFKIYRAPDSGGSPGAWTLIHTEPAGFGVMTYFNTTGLVSGTCYWYRIKAYNSAGDSAYSQTAACETAN